MYGIKVTLQDDGSLLFQAGNETRKDLSERLRESWDRAESEFFEMIRGEYLSKPRAAEEVLSYSLEWISPEDIYALTEMPMIGDSVRDDDDCLRIYGPIWGFPDYQITSYLGELAHKGRVIFSVVQDCGKNGIIFPSRFREKEKAENLAIQAFHHCIHGPYGFGGGA